MTAFTDQQDSQSLPASSSSHGDQERRRKRLEAIVNHGLPPFPNTILELSAILNKPSVDVKRAGKVIRADPSLSAHVLRLCNSPMFGLRTRVISIEQATILIGMDRLRSLAMTCSLVDYSGFGLPRNQVNKFWQHSFLAALLSEYLAKETNYCEKEQAYIAGLLHDIGQLPQWMLAAEEKSEKRTTPPEHWVDNTVVERDHFGMDHCEIGSSMAVTWNFMPSFIDVLGFHHEPLEAQHDQNLVAIIATIEQFLLTKFQAEPVPGKAVLSAGDEDQADEIIFSDAKEGHLLEFADLHPQTLVEMLDKEHARLLPLVEAGLKGTFGSPS